MKCPGQDSRYWKPGAIFEAECPECGASVEFFKDDRSRRCKKCGYRFLNPGMDFGCASYCKYAEQCIGNLPPELISQKEDLLKDRVAIEMKRYFQKDFKKIGHASRVARHAEAIGKGEGGNLAVVLAAAYLHDVGTKEAERRNNGAAAHSQQEETPAVAREILERLGGAKELVEEVCYILGHHHHPGDEETINFSCVYDADLIAKREEMHKEAPAKEEEVLDFIEKSLLTGTGRNLAKDVLLKDHALKD